MRYEGGRLGGCKAISLDGGDAGTADGHKRSQHTPAIQAAAGRESQHLKRVKHSKSVAWFNTSLRYELRCQASVPTALQKCGHGVFAAFWPANLRSFSI